MAINFIKNLSQLITGGIGIVDDELVYKDSGGNVKTAGGEFETVSEIPESLDPGEIVLVADPLAFGLWRGLKEGETVLDAGTPIPLKGYFSLAGTAKADLGDETASAEIVSSDMGNVNTGVSNGVGFFVYDALGFDINLSDQNTLVLVSGVLDEINVQETPISYRIETQRVDITQGVDGQVDVEGAFEIRFYPPKPE